MFSEYYPKAGEQARVIAAGFRTSSQGIPGAPPPSLFSDDWQIICHVIFYPGKLTYAGRLPQSQPGRTDSTLSGHQWHIEENKAVHRTNFSTRSNFCQAYLDFTECLLLSS
jgi:hypothetical protein